MPRGIPLMVGPSKSPSGTLLEETQLPHTPPTRPMIPAPFRSPYWILVDKLDPIRIPPWVGRPGRTLGRVGSGPGGVGWGLYTVLAYILRSIQNRAQTVKAKMHIWQNPMEPYLNMNPSATMIHMTSRYL